MVSESTFQETGLEITPASSYQLVRPNNIGGLYAVFIVIGIGSFILLPVALELATEVVSGSAESSSALLRCRSVVFFPTPGGDTYLGGAFSVNLFTFILVIGRPSTLYMNNPSILTILK
jgi:hypothetical protein